MEKPVINMKLLDNQEQIKFASHNKASFQDMFVILKKLSLEPKQTETETKIMGTKYHTAYIDISSENNPSNYIESLITKIEGEKIKSNINFRINLLPKKE